MAISGPQALKSLDDAIRDLRREEDELSNKLARGAERVAKLRETEAELFRKLAEIRLSPQVRAELSGRLSAAEKRAHDMIARHAEEVGAAEAAMKSLDTAVADKAKSRRAMLNKLEAAQAALDDLSGKVSASLTGNKAYAAQRDKAEELRHIAEESLKKTTQAEADREEKGRPYRQDPLFIYLWECGYGTRNYRANSLVRWLDGLVARLVRYDNARPNFAMLNDIPLRLREHTERQIANAEAAEAALEALEAKAVDAAGGKPMREALLAARAALEAFDAEMAELEDERDEQTRALRKLAEGSDPAFEEANRILATSLGQADIQGLLTAAGQTSTGADDALVAQIRDTRARIAEDESEQQDMRARLKTFAARRQELEDIEWEFKKSRFDDPRSTFGDNNLAGDLLGEFLRGAITAATYWDQWQKSQSWRTGSSDWNNTIGLPRSSRKGSSVPWSSGGGFNWPTGGSGGSSGGFSRPRTGSRGTRRHGGFKTGGRF